VASVHVDFDCPLEPVPLCKQNHAAEHEEHDDDGVGVAAFRHPHVLQEFLAPKYYRESLPYLAQQHQSLCSLQQYSLFHKGLDQLDYTESWTHYLVRLSYQNSQDTAVLTLLMYYETPSDDDSEMVDQRSDPFRPSVVFEVCAENVYKIKVYLSLK